MSGIEVVELGDPGVVEVVEIVADDPLEGAVVISVTGPGTPSNVVTLAQLPDVDTTGESPGKVLTYGTDGHWHPTALPAVTASGAVGLTFEVPTPLALVQITTGLAFKPGGITCLDADGIPTEFSTLDYPLPGVVEIGFDIPFGGVIYLS